MSDPTSLNHHNSHERMLYSPLVEKALRVSARAHHNQTRKASDLPYFQHPSSVALFLARCGFDDDELLAAAVLHDTIEDTHCTVESLTADFPEPVVRLVQECSEDKTDDSGEKIPWRIRKESHIAIACTASPSARAIMLADKLHNLGSMLFDIEQGEELWSRFNAQPDAMIWYHREIVTAAISDLPEETAPETVARIHRLADECRHLIDQLSQSIPT